MIKNIKELRSVKVFCISTNCRNVGLIFSFQWIGSWQINREYCYSSRLPLSFFFVSWFLFWIFRQLERTLFCIPLRLESLSFWFRTTLLCNWLSNSSCDSTELMYLWADFLSLKLCSVLLIMFDDDSKSTLFSPHPCLTVPFR